MKIHAPHEVPDRDLKNLVKKAVARVDQDVDGDVDKNDPKAGPYGEFVPSVDGKKRVYTKIKEDFISEVKEKEEDEEDDRDKKLDIRKGIKNKVKVFPEVKEQVDTEEKPKRVDPAQKRAQMQKVNLLQRKIHAIRSGGGSDIMASYEAEGEVVDEKMNLANADMGDVVKDFYKSDAPQFSGASKEKRRKMAVAAVLTARRGGRKLGEEKEGCDCCGKTPCECDNREMPTKASLLKNKMRARGIKVAGETPSPRNMKTYDEIDEQMTTQTQFKPLPSSGSTGVNRPPAAPTLPPPSASKPKAKPQTKQYSGYSITGNTIQMNSFEAEGEQLQEKPGDGYLGNTPIPNPIRLAKDAVDATNRASQKKVNAVNSVLPGSASMPKHTYFNKGPSAASQRYLGLKNSFEPEGEMTEEASDRARDKRQERGGVGANVDYSRPPAKKATNKELGIRDFTPEEKEKRRKEMIAHLKKMRKS